MTLNEYLKHAGKLSIEELGKAINVNNLDQIRQWQHAYAERKPSPENCFAIERATKGDVTRQELRPDDFWRIWPDLAHLAPEAKAA